MFPFNYQFNRTIRVEKTKKQVFDEVVNSLNQKNVKDIVINENSIVFNEGLFRARGNFDFLAYIDKGEFIYNEETKNLSYSAKMLTYNLIFIISSPILFYLFSNINHIAKWVPIIAFCFGNLVYYIQNQNFIDGIAKKINEE